MTPKKLTLARLAGHDFNRSLRVWKKYLKPEEILTRLCQERSRALAMSLRNGGIAAVGTLWLLANKSELSLKLALIELNVPASYVNFAVAFLLFGTVVHLLNYFVLNHFVMIASNKLFGFDCPWALTTILDGGSVWINGSILQFRFLSSGAAHKRLGRASAALANIPLVAILLVAFWAVIAVGINVVKNRGLFSLDAMFTLIAWVTLIYSISQIVLMFIPFTFAKNVQFVRWNFLWRLYRRQGLMPPRAGVWLATPIRKN